MKRNSLYPSLQKHNWGNYHLRGLNARYRKVLRKSEDEEKRTHIVFEFGEFSLKYPNHNESLKSWCKRTEGEYISNYGNKTIFEDITVLAVIGNIHELNQKK